MVESNWGKKRKASGTLRKSGDSKPPWRHDLELNTKRSEGSSQDKSWEQSILERENSMFKGPEQNYHVQCGWMEKNRT